jgi:protein-S-isoprenylcysteine O-methyltransferase Ste14
MNILMPMFYCLVSFVYFVATISLVPIKFYHVVGALISLTSFVLWITARMQLGNSFAIAANAKELVITGLYSKFRHPVYYFSITALLGINIFLWTFTITPVLIALIVVEVVRIRNEERVLAAAFGRRYRGYKRRTWF